MSRADVSRADGAARAGARHERDAVSLMAGLLLVLVAGGFLLADLTTVSIQARWVGPVVLLVVGAAGLLASLRAPATSAEPTDAPQSADAAAPTVSRPPTDAPAP